MAYRPDLDPLRDKLADRREQPMLDKTVPKMGDRGPENGPVYDVYENDPTGEGESMATQQDTIDRRTVLKLIGAAGAWPALAHASGVAQAGVEPFEFRVSDDELVDLRRRLSSVRWPGDSPGAAWSYGTDRAFLEQLVVYWRDQYDWRVHEAELNAFDHYTTTIEGQHIHFIHQQGRGTSPMPLVLTHGWPGTIWEMLPSIRALSDPAAHGGEATDSFDVVVPSIPGFGFSGEPIEGTDAARTAELWVALMEQLGYRPLRRIRQRLGCADHSPARRAISRPARRCHHAGDAAEG